MIDFEGAPMFGLFKKKSAARPGIDPSTLSQAVRADIRRNLETIEEVTPQHLNAIYDAALRSAGGRLDILFQALIGIGLGKRRASEITRLICFKARSLIEAERQLKLGIEYALWSYSNAPCGDPAQDAAHKAVNGKPYALAKGMFVNGVWTRPGYENDCKCSSRPLIKAFGNIGEKPEGLVE
jgi:hypothetical protein